MDYGPNGEEATRHGKLPARHGYGAVMEVDAQCKVHGVFQHAKRFHVVRKSRVAKSGALFRGRDGLIDHDRRITREKLHEPQISPSVSFG